MRYAKIREMDVANGQGIGVSLFVQGCPHHCDGCFNPETWDFSGGEEWTDKIHEEFLNLIDADYINHVTILGGEPFAPENRDTVALLIHDIKHRYPQKKVWVYTGYKYEYIKNNYYYLIVNVDVLVDGKFVKELANVKYPWAGSMNQRVIDVQKTLDKDKMILLGE